MNLNLTDINSLITIYRISESGINREEVINSLMREFNCEFRANGQ